MNPACSRSCDVVVVNYNAGNLLADCVGSALREGASRVVVVDNCSTDSSLQHLLDCVSDSRLQVVKSPNNAGFAAACNIGARASDADSVLFLNPDGILSPGALDRLMEALHSSPSTGMVGAVLRNPDGSEQPGGRRVIPTPRRAFMRAFRMSGLCRWFPAFCSDFLLHKEPLPAASVPVEAISGACMLVKRTAFEQVGPWDEQYFLHCEDLDWCMRFREHGLRILFVPGAEVVHYKGTCSASRPLFVEWHKHKGMVRFYRKFFRHQYPGVLMWLVTIGVWVRFSGITCRVLAGRLFHYLRETPA